MSKTQCSIIILSAAHNLNRVLSFNESHVLLSKRKGSLAIINIFFLTTNKLLFSYFPLFLSLIHFNKSAKVNFFIIFRHIFDLLAQGSANRLTCGPQWLSKSDGGAGVAADGWLVLVTHLIEEKIYYGISKHMFSFNKSNMTKCIFQYTLKSLCKYWNNQ